jgi:PilZ domain-containing protein
VRYKLRLPVIFHWNDGSDHTEGGFTVDIALDGALIASNTFPPIGADVRIEVLVPSPGKDQMQIRIECNGKVTRVAGTNGTNYFGVRGIFDDDQLTRQFYMNRFVKYVCS